MGGIIGRIGSGLERITTLPQRLHEAAVIKKHGPMGESLMHGIIMPYAMTTATHAGIVNRGMRENTLFGEFRFRAQLGYENKLMSNFLEQGFDPQMVGFDIPLTLGVAKEKFEFKNLPWFVKFSSDEDDKQIGFSLSQRFSSLAEEVVRADTLPLLRIVKTAEDKYLAWYASFYNGGNCKAYTYALLDQEGRTVASDRTEITYYRMGGRGSVRSRTPDQNTKELHDWISASRTSPLFGFPRGADSQMEIVAAKKMFDAHNIIRVVGR